MLNSNTNPPKTLTADGTAGIPLYRRKGLETLRSALPATKTCFRMKIQSYKEDLKGQTVAVVGLGISGRAAVKLALARGATVLAIDRDEQLLPLEHDPMFANHVKLRTVLGHLDRKLPEDADRVVVSPGVPLENYGLSALLQSRTLVMSELDFAAEVLPSSIKVLGVTGTNGKSTVTTFAGQMLHQLGIKAFTGGNLGNPLSDAAIQCLESSSAKDLFRASSNSSVEFASSILPVTFQATLNVASGFR